MNKKIQLQHPANKKAISMDEKKYKIMRTAILHQLRDLKACSHTDLWNAVAKYLAVNSIPFEGSIQWHCEWVKLDLEAKQVIERMVQDKVELYKIKRIKE